MIKKKFPFGKFCIKSKFLHFFHHLKDINSLLCQVATGFKNPQIAHGILTPEGLSCSLKGTRNNRSFPHVISELGTFVWIHADTSGGTWPQRHLDSLTTEKSHVWSLACIAAELFLGFPFYTTYCDCEMIWNITQTHGHSPDHLP